MKCILRLKLLPVLQVFQTYQIRQNLWVGVLWGLLALIISTSHAPVHATVLYQSNSRYATYENAIYGFSLVHPTEWSVEEQNWANDDVQKFDFLLRLRMPSGEMLSILIWNHIDALTAGEWAQQNLQPIISSTVPANPNAKLAGREAVTVLSRSDDGPPVIVYIQLVNGREGYRVQYTANAGGFDYEALVMVLHSLRFNQERQVDAILPNTLSKQLSELSILTAATVMDTSHCGPNNEYYDPTYNRYDCGQCTWWAAYSRPDIPTNPDEWAAHAHGMYWDDRAVQHPGLNVVSLPEPGAIAVWEQNPNVAGDVGHVAYITGVNSDGTFTVSEMNWRPCTARARDVCTRTVTPRDGISYIPAAVTLFEAPNFGGRATSVEDLIRLRGSKGYLNHGYFVNGNRIDQSISSIYIPSGWFMKAYSNTNFSGAFRERYGSHSLNSSLWNLSEDNFSDGSNMNNRVRSIQIALTGDRCQVPNGTSSASIEIDCAVPPTTDTTPPSATGFSASISGRNVQLSVSGVSDNSGGSGIDRVNYSAKWNGNWYGIGSSSIAPYSLTWDTCASGVPNTANLGLELGMEVVDKAGNKWIWSNHYPNPHVKKNYVCTGNETPQPGNVWNLQGWMNSYLAGYVNWEGIVWWDNGYPYIWEDWKLGPPFDGWSGDEFSLKYWRDVYFPGGDYQFGIRSDDGARIMLGGESRENPTMNCWYDVCDDSRVRYVSPGTHRVTVEYYEKTGDARLFAYWYGPGYPRPDLEYPKGRITSPSDLSATSSSPLKISAEASDDASGVDRVSFWAWYCKDGNCDWRHLGNDYSAPYEMTWNWSSVPEQMVYFAIDVYDKSGKGTGNAGGWRRVVIDRTPPQVAVVQPLFGQRHPQKQIEIKVDSFDAESGAQKARFFVGYNDNSSTFWREIGWDTDATDQYFSKTWDSSGVGENVPIAFSILVYDKAGNYTESSVWENLVPPANERVRAIGAMVQDEDNWEVFTVPARSKVELTLIVENITQDDLPAELIYLVTRDNVYEEFFGSYDVVIEPGTWYWILPYQIPDKDGE